MAIAEDDSDEALMLRIGRLEAAAFSALVGRHAGRITGMAWRMTGNRAESEDIAQEAFARVWVHAPKWRPAAEGGASFTTWLYRVVANLCIDRKRRPAPDALDSIAEPADERENAHDRIVEHQLSAAVGAAVRALPERQKTALVLCFYEGMSNGEAAEIMGLSVGAIESLLVRARRALKERLAALHAELVQG